MHDFRIANGATEVLLIRHGAAQPLPTGEAFTPKDVDLPLTEHGRKQVSALAERLRDRKIDAVFSSPLQRTMQTAQPVADACGVQVVADERLREVEIAGIGPLALHDLAEIAIANGGWSHLPGTERSDAIRGRMREAIDEIVASHPGKRVAVVSHAGAINAYIGALLGLQSDFFFPAGNTSLSVVRARDDRRLLVTLNDISHLERHDAR